ncbi:MAG: hypothetical protein AAGB22_04980, partial [Bacteroidota bacterium]
MPRLRLVAFWIFVLIGFASSQQVVAQVLHNTDCSVISTNFTLDWDASPSGSQFSWTPQGNTTFTASNIQGSGHTVAFALTGATSTLATENGISTPGVTTSLSGGADALHISSSGLDAAEELRLTMTFTPAIAGQISFDLYNIIEQFISGPDPGQQVEVFALTSSGFAIVPEIIDNGAPSWELEGPGVLDGNASSTTSTNDQIGINFRSIDDVSTITVIMRRCSSCDNTGNTEFAIGDIDFCLTPDTDQDGVPDTQDDDDDNDGITDLIEKCPIGQPDTLDWDLNAFPSGNSSVSYALPDGTGLVVSAESNGAAIVALETSTFITGGIAGTPTTLLVNGDQTSQKNSIDIILDFDQAVDSLEFQVLDVDADPTQWVDSLTIIGFFNGFVVFPSLTGSANNTVTQNRVVGLSSVLETTGTANVSVAFDEPIDSVILFYGNGTSAPDAPGNQWIALHDLFYIGDCGAVDTDGDGIDDYLDIDADGDGIVDYIEWQGTTASPIAPAGADDDGDGIDNNFESVGAPVDTDGDGIPDPFDPDADDDEDLDILEAWDTDNDGVANVLPSGNDADMDGLDDNFDNVNGLNSTTNVTNNGQTSNDFPNLDKSSTSERDWREDDDIDDDGIQEYADVDDDNDGIPDVDEYPGGNDPNGDEDGDGIPNWADPTDDGNGGDGSTTDYTDSNGDDIPDIFDEDGDGLPNHRDLDSDNDGIPDLYESGIASGTLATIDTDNNGVIDAAQTVGANGLANVVESGSETGNVNYTISDADGDGSLDIADLDADNDGILDLEESGTGTDSNNDGVVDGSSDADNDGILDSADSNDSAFGSPSTSV